jgi:antibiotic biosynthesis monooxygenase (ABM) superfamily enzyme
MGELSPYLESKEVTLAESIDPTGGSVSIAVVTHVKEGHEKEYFAYERKYQSAQARTPGYHGAYVQPPQKSTPGSWITIIRFATSKAMDQWFASNERKELIAESNLLVSSTDFQNVATSFPGWFPSEAKAGEGPPNWKTALLILLGLYPSVMLVIKYFLPLMHGFFPALNNFIGNILTVAFTTWVTMPLFIKIYKSWLFPNPTTPKWVSPLSMLSLIFFFLLEIAFFWRLI